MPLFFIGPVGMPRSPHSLLVLLQSLLSASWQWGEATGMIKSNNFHFFARDLMPHAPVPARMHVGLPNARLPFARPAMPFGRVGQGFIRAGNSNGVNLSLHYKLVFRSR